MTYTFKLARRLARFRTGMLLGIVFTSACAGTDSALGPESGSNPLNPTSVDVFPDSASIDVSGEMQFDAHTVAGSEGIADRHQSWRGHWLRIVRVKLDPDSIAVAPGTARSFAASGQTAYGSVVRPILRWTATGGTVDSMGKYLAGTVPGRFRVIATSSNDVADTATVVITPPGQTVDRVELSPASATLAAGATQQFTAAGKTGEGAAVLTVVTYNATGGTIGHSGLYAAGQTAGTYLVIAMDSAAGRADTAVVTITGGSPAPVLEAVVLSPPTVSLAPGGQQDFNAVGKMTDGSTKAINISYIATGGAITTAGIYTAGSVAGSYRVIATQTGGTLADTAAVTIITTIPTLQAVVLTPASVTLQSGATREFAVSGRMSDGSTTTVNATYRATGGTITSGGLYTGGASAGAFQVIATQHGGTKADTSSVTVTVTTQPPPPPPPPPSGSCARTVNVTTVAALTSAVAAALPGDCINVAPGTYGLTWNLTLTRNGTAAQPITIQGAGSNTIIDGNGGQIYFQADYTRLRKMRFTDLGVQGMWLQGATYNVFDSLEIDNTKQVAFAFKDGSHHNVVSNSWYHDTGTVIPYYGEAIYVGNSGYSMPLQFSNTDNQILYNRFGPNVRANHLDIKEGSDRTLVKGNVFDGTGTIWDAARGMGALIDVGASGTIIEDNTISKGAPTAIKFLAPSTGTMSGNIVRANTVDLQNVNNTTVERYAFNLTVNTNQPGRVVIKCSNVVTNGPFSNVACTP